MSGLSDYIELALLNEVFRNVGYTPAATIYCSLHTADPGETGASEISGGAGPYARKTVTFAAAASSAISTNADVTFTGLPGATVTHWGIWDALTTGNFLVGGQLVTARGVVAGDSFTVLSGNITIVMD